jgi:GT2 family glycosyltransferase
MPTAKQQSTSNIQYSVVIVVKNDRGVEESLRALAPIVKLRKDMEVMVVDASKPEVLQDIKETFSWVRWLYYSDPNKRLTIPEQRNLGIASARGDVVIFLDANCVPQSQWLDAIDTAFAEEGHDVVTGPIASVGGNTLHDGGYTGFKDGQVITECGAANLAMRKKVFAKIGEFDNDLSYGEDVDLTWRARKAGFKIVFKKDMAIAHDWGAFHEELRRTIRYGMSRTTIYKKHPDQWRLLFGQDINVLIYAGYIVCLPVTIVFPWYPLIIIVPLLKNVRHHALQTTTLHLLYGYGVLKGIFRKV